MAEKTIDRWLKDSKNKGFYCIDDLESEMYTITQSVLFRCTFGQEYTDESTYRFSEDIAFVYLFLLILYLVSSYAHRDTNWFIYIYKDMEGDRAACKGITTNSGKKSQVRSRCTVQYNTVRKIYKYL